MEACLEVRDPIHGSMRIGPRELRVVDHPFVQRLRNIRQTGFSALPFPGATHSRHAHCLGTMHLAGAAFDSVYHGWEFSTPAVRARLRSCLRLAALCHDLGHPPFSHCTEFAMPGVSALGLSWLKEGAQPPKRRANHEDYTLAILEHTSLCQLIGQEFPYTARHVAGLVDLDVGVGDDFFVDRGLDHRRLLSQIISSELDVDRLDYLVRDSYYSGARYGQIDVDWLMSNLRPWPTDSGVSLALDGRAIYAFDDFMIARHHMFLMVYFHHKSVVYEELLKRHVASPECTWSIPADLHAYLFVDDISLEAHLRDRATVWARRVVDRDPFQRIVERHGTPQDVDLSAEARALEAAGIEVIHAGSTGEISRYNVFGQKRQRAPEIYVAERAQIGRAATASPLADATRVFQRYADARRIARLYVAPEDVAAATAVLTPVA